MIDIYLRSQSKVSSESKNVNEPSIDLNSESVLTVSKIVEQKEVFEKRYKFRKDQLGSSFEESTIKTEEVRETVKYSPAAAHEMLNAIVEKNAGADPKSKVRVLPGDTLRKLTSKSLIAVGSSFISMSVLKYIAHFNKAPMLNSIIKASIRMSGISLIQLITFLCLIIPSFVIAKPSDEENSSRDISHFILIWKVMVRYYNSVSHKT